jgi:cell division transport system permease protein
MVLVLLGLVVIFVLTAKKLSESVRENLTVTVVLQDDASTQDAKKLMTELSQKAYVNEIEYISSEQALNEQIEAMGLDPTEFLGTNPFSISMELKMKADYACNDSLKMIEKRISSMEGVREVTWQKDLLDIINSNIRKVACILLILALILSLVSFTLINNTIKLTIYAQRFILYSMKLVGAKWSFIRKPFIIRNLWVGLASATLTCIMIWYGLKIGLRYEPWLIMLAEPKIIIPVFVVVTLIGLLITGICAMHSVNRFLRMKSGELHYV